MVQISIKTLTWWPSSSEGGSNIKLKSDKVLAVVKTTVGENLEGRWDIFKGRTPGLIAR